MFKSNAQYYIKETISSTAGTGTTFKISPDFELGQNLETGTDNVSVKLVNGTQIERMTITATGGVATIVQRGLTQADTKVEDTNLRKTWTDGTIMTIVALASDLPDLDKSSGINTFTADIKTTNNKKVYIGDNAYLTTTNNGTDLQLKDGNNTTKTLSELASGSGTDHKVAVSGTDTTADFLTNKITTTGYISKTIVNPGTNETLDFTFNNTSGVLNPSGIIQIWTTGTAPTGWLICDGSAISRATYSVLFGVIGTTYGVGDGSTTFNLPNLKGKVVVGFNSVETEFDTLGETGGEKTHLLTINEIPNHSHTVNLAGSSAQGGTQAQTTNGTFWGTMNTSSVGGGLAHNNLQPYITLNYIIKI